MSDTIRYHQLPYCSHPASFDISQKVELFERALVEHPEDSIKIMRFLMPYLYMHPEKHERCLQICEMALREATSVHDRAEALVYSANILLEDRHDYEEAEKRYLETLRLEPDHEVALVHIIELYTEKGEFEKACHWANMMVSEEGLEEAGQVERGFVLLRWGKGDESKKAFERALEVNSANAQAYDGLGRYFAGRSRYEEARSYFRKAWETGNMSYPSHAYCLALCYQRTDDPYRALHWYTKALELDPTYPEALNNVAAVHYELSGSFNEAIPYLIRAVELSNEAINRSMAVIYRNLWMHYNSILEHEKANYFQKLHLRCVGLDGLASFLDDN